MKKAYLGPSNVAKKVRSAMGIALKSERGKPALLRYGLPIVSVVATVFIKNLLEPYLGEYRSEEHTSEL